LDLQENAQIGLPLPDYINQLLENINQIHREFHRSLRHNKLTTQGFNYYRVAQSIDKICLDEFKKIYFLGFFALNACEKRIIKYLLEKDQACLIWQRDNDKWSILDELEEFFAIQPERIESKAVYPEIQIYECFNTHSQMEGVRQVLSNLDNLENTCVVLPQAGCLMPLLYHALPPDLTHYNISLGYPLRHAPIYALIDMIMQALERRRQDGSFYAKDYFLEAPVDNPTGPKYGKRRVIRGGGWRSGKMCATVVFRQSLRPHWVDINVGFRCAKDH